MLFLVGMGLNEQTVNKNFDFIGYAEEANVFTLMKNLTGKPESEPHADLLEYLLEVGNYCYSFHVKFHLLYMLKIRF